MVGTTILLAVLWAVGSALCFLRFILSLVSASQLRKRLSPLDEPVMMQIIESVARRLHIKRQIKLLQSEVSSVPFTLGILSPAVVVPLEAENWSTDQCRAVLTHELAHVARNDIMRQYLTQLAVAVYWFHPLVWFASWRIRVERELACDDLVLLEGEHPCDYADILFHFAANLQGQNRQYILGCAVAMARRSGVTHRIAAILNPKIRRTSSFITIFCPF
jgi:beta-lactamase regulating signal transducer with metallopeptidase domain